MSGSWGEHTIFDKQRHYRKERGWLQNQQFTGGSGCYGEENARCRGS